jgi:hypothetical protein
MLPNRLDNFLILSSSFSSKDWRLDSFEIEPPSNQPWELDYTEFCFLIIWSNNS